MCAKKSTESVPIKRLQEFEVAVEIGGDDIIQNCFSQKAIEEILRKHMGLSVTREPKKPRQLIENATIRNVNGAVSIPPPAIKKGILTASAAIKSFKKTQLRPSLWIYGGSIPITYERMVPRMDMVRLNSIGRPPDVRFRPMFENWRARLIIGFTEILAVETVIDLLSRAGKVGVGEWRPEKDGSHGTYSVLRNLTDDKEIEEVRSLCAPQIKPLVIPDWAMDAEVSDDILQRVAGATSSDASPDDDVVETKEIAVGDQVDLDKEVPDA